MKLDSARRLVLVLSTFTLLSGNALEIARATTMGILTFVGGTRFEDILPSDCLLFASLDLTGATPIERLAKEPEVVHFARDVLAQIEKKDPQLFRVIDSIEVLLEDVSRIQVSLGGADRPRSFAVAFEVSTDTESFLEKLMRVMSAFRTEAGPTEVIEKEYRHNGHRISEVGLQGSDIAMTYTLLDSMLIAGPDPSYIHSLVNNYDEATRSSGAPSRSEPPLSRIDHFLKARKQVEDEDDESRVLVFLNIRELRKHIIPYLDQDSRHAFTMLGLGSAEALCYAMQEDADAYNERLFLLTSGVKEGLCRLIASPRNAFKSIGHVPDDAVLFAASQVDWTYYVEALRGIPGQAAVLSAFERASKLSIDSDIVPAIGSEFAMCVIYPPDRASIIPDWIISVEVQDRKRIEAAVTAILKTGGLELRPYGGVGQENQKESLSLLVASDTETLQGSEFLSVFTSYRPTLLYADGMVFLGSRPELLLPIQKGAAAGEPRDDALLAKPDFRRSIPQATSPACALEYIDLKQIFRLAYSFLIRFQINGRSAVSFLPVDPALLPAQETITRHLTGIGARVCSQDDGFLAEIRSPIPAAGLLPIAVATVAYLQMTPQAPAKPEREWQGMETGIRQKLGKVRMMITLEGDLEGAIELCDAVIREDPACLDAYFFRGLARTYLCRTPKATPADFDQARKDFEKASHSEAMRAPSLYNIACVHSLQNRREEALAWLRHIVKQGLVEKKQLLDDEDLDNLRTEPGFRKLLLDYDKLVEEGR